MIRFLCIHCKAICLAEHKNLGQNVSCNHCGQPTPAPPTPLSPKIVIKNFVIQKQLGKGGMGIVFFAYHILSGQSVALKILHSSLTNQQIVIEKFLKEARIMGSMSHPNIIRVFESGEDNGIYYSVMEYVEGLTLREILEGSGRIGTNRALTVALKIAEAIKFAWEQGQYIHNDIKPDNIMLTSEKNVKLTDLGLVQSVNEASESKDNLIVGTPPYISPERLLKNHIDFRSDFYSLGATLYHLLTGRFPYLSQSSKDFIYKHLYERLVPPHLFIPDIGRSLSALIQIMMCKRPEHRHKSVDELLADIVRVSNGEPPLYVLSPHAQDPIQTLSEAASNEDLNEQEDRKLTTTNHEGKETYTAQHDPNLQEGVTFSARIFNFLLGRYRRKKASKRHLSSEKKDSAVSIHSSSLTSSDYWWSIPAKPFSKSCYFEAIDSHSLYQSLQKKLREKKIELIEIPKNISRILKVLQDEEIDYHLLSELINQSPLLAGEFLRLANSTFFNRGLPIKDLRVSTIVRFPKANIKSVLYLHIVRSALNKVSLLQDIVNGIIEHSMSVAKIIYYLAQRYYPDAQEAFMAGLLHDIGKIAILNEIDKNYSFPKTVNFELTEACFDEILPIMHEKGGRLIADHWNLPGDTRIAIAHHHTVYHLEGKEVPESALHLVALVNLSDIMARILGKGRFLDGINLFELPACRYLGIKEDRATTEFFKPIPNLI